jgi:Peptidase A4 family
MTAAIRAGAVAIAIAIVPAVSALTAPAAARTGTAAPSAAAARATARVAAPGYPDIRVAPRRAARQPDVSNVTSSDSLNWAGYALSRRDLTFTAVRATFFVPYLNCAQSPGPALSSEWVGLDGFVGRAETVEQGGIGANCSAAGKASYFGWYEMFPRPESRAPLAVSAGNSVTVSVSYDPATKDFRISIVDNTTGSRSTVLRACPRVKVSGRLVRCLRNSAEVITEAPDIGSGSHLMIAHLADYGAISFAGIAVTDGRGAHGSVLSTHWTTTKIIQLGSSNGPTLARPTPTQGESFDTYWLRAG